MERIIAAGLLVGAGTGLGNGCTSGHGICGNSRFSVRSMVYTGLFMATGFATATLFDTNGGLGVDSTHVALSDMNLPSGETMTRYAAIVAAAAASFLGLAPRPRRSARRATTNTPARTRRSTSSRKPSQGSCSASV